ncbi:MAG TPA: RNA polymerase sigma factor [Solirubrobacterales bacterium]|nr:RNA polymerase sigma factor [Solirubrobacterales bacterium]
MAEVDFGTLGSHAGVVLGRGGDGGVGTAVRSALDPAPERAAAPRAAAPEEVEPRRDAELVRAARRGSEEAVEALFRRHWRRAHRAAFLIVRDADAAEDIAQEAFLAAMRALDRFDRRRPFRPWLHRIVVNRAIDHARARALRREVEADAVGEPAAPEVDAGLDPDLAAALAALDPEQRAAIVLRYLLEYTPGEIARMLELPRGTVNSRLRRGLDRLAAALDGVLR